MQETFQELKALGDVQAVEEIPFAMGALISYPRAARADHPLAQLLPESPATNRAGASGRPLHRRAVKAAL